MFYMFNISDVYTKYIHIYITNYIDTIVLHRFVDLYIYLQNMYVLSTISTLM